MGSDWGRATWQRLKTRNRCDTQLNLDRAFSNFVSFFMMCFVDIETGKLAPSATAAAGLSSSSIQGAEAVEGID